MTTQEWKPTACNLCYANCGVLVLVDEEKGTIEKVKGDKSHPVSKGYTCNKAASLNYYQNGRDRLSQPLRRKPDGSFEAIDWDTAIREIADKLKAIRDTHGGDKILYYGGGGQGNHMGGMYSPSLRASLGVKYASNAIAQEKTGLAWMSARMLGGGYHGDFHHCDVAIIIGKNPWQSNGMQRARILMRDISRDPDRTLIVLDPRRTETAELADIHLALNPGTDVWCLTAILGYMVQNDLANVAWLKENTTGYERLLAHLADVPVADYAKFAGIELDQIIAAAKAIGATNKIAVYEDLGIEMAPYSTLCSYLNILMFIVPGAFDVDGGTHLFSGLASAISIGREAREDERGHETGRPVTPVTGARIIAGLIPCNSIPEEILTDHEDRLRAVFVESANPLHSLADSKRMREAFDALELVVVVDVAMTETARAADYVLPASSQYEKLEATTFPAEFPENFFHLRHPILPPMPGTLSEPEMHARLVEALGTFEEGELDYLKDAAAEGMERFTEIMMTAMADRKIAKHISYVLYRTLGPALPEGMASAAALWGLSQRFAMSMTKAVQEAGCDGEGLNLGNNLFNKVLNGKSGVIISKEEIGDPSQWRHADRKLHLNIGEMLDEMEELADYRLPGRSEEFPLLLCAGERRSYTAQTIIRDPAWQKNNHPASLAIHPTDVSELGLADGGFARLVTKRGAAEVLIVADDRMKLGTISLPNGQGLVYPDETGALRQNGVAPNDLTDLDHRDKWVGTPWHKHVGARLERLSVGAE